MKLPTFMCILSGLMLFDISKTTAQRFDTIKISVYYDAAGNASAEFMINQLLASYPIIGSKMHMDLVPYCLAEMLPGSESYRANVVHECAFCQNCDDQKEHLDFAACIISTGRVITDENVEKCALQTSLPYETIINCANGADGRERLTNNGYKTRAVYPPIYQLPTIAANGWVHSAIQTDVKEHFLRYVCSFLNDPPKECTNYN